MLYRAFYNINREKLILLQKNLIKLLCKNFIRFNKLLAGALVLFARKPGGGLRFCINYNGLNAIIKKDRYLIPLIKEVIIAINKVK